MPACLSLAADVAAAAAASRIILLLLLVSESTGKSDYNLSYLACVLWSLICLAVHRRGWSHEECHATTWNHERPFSHTKVQLTQWCRYLSFINVSTAVKVRLKFCCQNVLNSSSCYGTFTKTKRWRICGKKISGAARGCERDTKLLFKDINENANSNKK